MGKRPAPGAACQPIRKVFAWYQADGRYSVKINSRRLPVNCPMAINIMVFRRKRRVEDWQT